MPPTYVSGLFGMNIKVPMQNFPEVPPGYDPEDESLPGYLWLYGYIPFLLVNIIGFAISFALWLCFRKKIEI